VKEEEEEENKEEGGGAEAGLDETIGPSRGTLCMLLLSAEVFREHVHSEGVGRKRRS